MAKDNNKKMLALTGCTGKIGGAVLRALLQHNILPPSSLVVCTSSTPDSPKLLEARDQGVQIRQSNYDDRASMVAAFAGCDALFLVSTPQISLDFNNAPYGKGRESQHFNAIDAAVQAGVKHIYYTSLAFASDSVAGVMRAHLRTEAYLANLYRDGKLTFTVIREGLYNESWPLYFGYYYGLKDDDRNEVVVAGDGPVSWTSIADLGLATALVLGSESKQEYEERTLYLSSGAKPVDLKEIAKTVSRIKGREVKLKVVSPAEYVEHYVSQGRDRASVEWWVSSYAALTRNECQIRDPTFGKLLTTKGVKPKSLEQTIEEMLS